MGGKVVNTKFGKRKAFCNCDLRLTKERVEFLEQISKEIDYQLEPCGTCGYYAVSFNNPNHAKRYKNLYNKQHLYKN